MMRFLIKIAIIYAFWQAIDMDSESTFASVLAPIAFGLSLLTWGVWVMLKLVDRELSQSRRSSGQASGGGSFHVGGSSSGENGSGDGGGGGDSC